MRVVGISEDECACADFATRLGCTPIYLHGAGAAAKALAILRAQAGDGRAYHGGVHVDGVHVTALYGDDGAALLESDGRRQTRLLGRLHEPHELLALGWR